ncbi:MAG: plasmid pRiA4b ORF-3 family protein [Planctomycetota bacterium]
MPSQQYSIAKPVAYQFKIRLADAEPPIWRRILVPDGTLDDLHGWIQTAMGWTNSLLRQFQLGREVYRDPELLDDGFEDVRFIDSLKTALAELFDTNRAPKLFNHKYDFGEGWPHNVEFEGIQQAPRGKKPPWRLAGERCCPPEDVGSLCGNEEFLSAIGDPERKGTRIISRGKGELSIRKGSAWPRRPAPCATVSSIGAASDRPL